MAEWLRRGLQILAPRFDSGRGLHRSPHYHFAASPRGPDSVCRVSHVFRADPHLSRNLPTVNAFGGAGVRTPLRRGGKKRHRSPLPPPGSGVCHWRVPAQIKKSSELEQRRRRRVCRDRRAAPSTLCGPARLLPARSLLGDGTTCGGYEPAAFFFSRRFAKDALRNNPCPRPFFSGTLRRRKR